NARLCCAEAKKPCTSADRNSMDPHRPVQTVDLWDVRLRAGTVRFAVWITIAVCSIAAAYLFATWTEPHRPLMLGLVGGAGATTLARSEEHTSELQSRSDLV